MLENSTFEFFFFFTSTLTSNSLIFRAMYSVNLKYRDYLGSFSYTMKIFVIVTVITRNKNVSTNYLEKEKDLQTFDMTIASCNELFK